MADDETLRMRWLSRVWDQLHGGDEDTDYDKLWRERVRDMKAIRHSFRDALQRDDTEQLTTVLDDVRKDYPVADLIRRETGGGNLVLAAYNLGAHKCMRFLIRRRLVTVQEADRLLCECARRRGDWPIYDLFLDVGCTDMTHPTTAARRRKSRFHARKHPRQHKGDISPAVKRQLLETLKAKRNKQVHEQLREALEETGDADALTLLDTANLDLIA